jgi:hypothetical protein
MRSLILLAFAALSFAAGPPSGFHKIFNGRDLTGWHISQISAHGNSRGWTAKSGVLSGSEDPIGNGGILLSDRKYHNFEISLEVQPDFGCDGAVLLRSNEKGEAYEITLGYQDGGTVGSVRGPGIEPAASSKGWLEAWNRGDWNHIRARIEGEFPRIQVWLNDKPLVDWTDKTNHLPNGATEGLVGLLVRPARGGLHRFRNVAIKELP